MKKILALFLFLLAGCVTANRDYVQNSFQSASEIEMAAWQEAQKQSNDMCGSYDKSNPLPREEALDVASCYSKVVRTIVGPKAISPQAMNKYLVEYQDISLKYKKGEIDRDESNLAAQKAWFGYTAKIENMYQNAMSQAYQADVNAVQQRQQAIQNMNSQVQDMQNSNSTMKTTNCQQTVPGHVSCTTW